MSYSWATMTQVVAVVMHDPVLHLERCSSPVCLGVHGPQYCTHTSCALVWLMEAKIRQFSDSLEGKLEKNYFEEEVLLPEGSRWSIGSMRTSSRRSPGKRT